jgi:hypothetical protein
MRFGIPIRHRSVVSLVQDDPFFAVALGLLLPGSDQHHTTAKLLAVEFHVQFAGFDRGGRVVGAVQLPRAAVPDDDIARAVFPFRDNAFEVCVLERVVFHAHRPASHTRRQRPLGTAQLTNAPSTSSRKS